MPDGVSIFEVIKRGGYEASLITTFNATLPFYEEVVLRKLVGAGCRHNVVLMDRQQCALSWESEALRPRRAGYDYTLLPVGVAGAFHPKVCLLLGPRKAAILIGSHNLTLSGFGYNREVTNWVEVAGPKDLEGTAVLAAAWKMVRGWIEIERGTAPDALLDSALAITNFVSPLIASAGEMETVIAIGQRPGQRSLIEQLSDMAPRNVSRIGVVGAFFDREQSMIKELSKRWPAAEIVVGIDPQTVELPGSPDMTIATYVDARPLWPGESGYLHAKAIYLETDDVAMDAFVSGSANPSRPAWMATASAGNVEAVLLRLGQEARAVAETIGLRGVFGLPALPQDVCADIAARCTPRIDEGQPRAIPLYSGVADSVAGQLRIFGTGSLPDVTVATLFGASMEELEKISKIESVGTHLVLSPEVSLTGIRSCLLASGGEIVARVMVLHPAVLEAASRSSKQYQIRAALGGLGSSEGDISKLIATVEKVIFADETAREVDQAVREHQERRAAATSKAGPESLTISVADMAKTKKKTRLLKSGDLACLIDVLLRHLSEGLERVGIDTDKSGRTEEEQIGKEDVEPVEADEETQAATALSDLEIACRVAAKARSMTRKMVKQLELAARDEPRRVGAVVKLVAVLALIRQLRQLDKLKRWRATGQLLVDERDRRYVLDQSIKYLFGTKNPLIEVLDSVAGESTDEATQLRVLLLWLAWDVGEELTEQIDRSLLFEPAALRSRLQANAFFVKLMPCVVREEDAKADLQESIQRTTKPTPEAAQRAAQWLARHWEFGSRWARGTHELADLRIGGFCRVQAQGGDPRVVVELDHDNVGFWNFDQVKRFRRDRVVGVAPIESSAP